MKKPIEYKRSKETVEKLRTSHIGIKHKRGYSQKQSKIMKEINKNPEVRKLNSEVHKQNYIDNPHLRKLRSVTIKTAWDTEDYRLKKIEKLVGGFWYGNVKYPNPPKYCNKFNNTFKERCRAYWGWTCVVCGKRETEERRLCVHHVHYDKKMCCNGSPRDVVALCNACHTATNVNRELWETAFVNLIYSNEHNGKSYLTQEDYENLLK